MKYTCKSPKMASWVGEIKILSHEGNTIEAEINARSTYFHIITGSHQYGNYLCIVNHDIGCELAHLTDTFWNEERLRNHLSKADAISVSQALLHMKEALA